MTFGNKMKLLAILFSSIPFLVFGGESYFFTLVGEPTGQRIEGENLHIVLPIKKLDPPVASSIIAYHQGLGPGREYQIQVNLKSSPKKRWMPMLNLGGEIIMDGVSVARPDDARFASSFSLEGDDPEKIRQWCKLLGNLLKLPAERIKINLTKEAEQDGADQPATAPESKSEGDSKPQPESEGRPQ
jgi:hypothetical protein